MSAVASEAVGASVDALPTPCLVVDLDRLEANLARMAQEIAATGARLRPHTKTHKTAEVARMQLEHGAAGIAVAKLGEAEAMADAGLDDILVANEVVGAGKAERLAELVRHIAVRTCVDGLDVARRAWTCPFCSTSIRASAGREWRRSARLTWGRRSPGSRGSTSSASSPTRGTAPRPTPRTAGAGRFARRSSRSAWRARCATAEWTRAR
jgi:hypothetical protein